MGTVSNNKASAKNKVVSKPSPNKAETTTKTVSEVTDKNPLHFEMTADQMVRGIILSEILGKPVSKRHGFGSTGLYRTR